MGRRRINLLDGRFSVSFVLVIVAMGLSACQESPNWNREDLRARCETSRPTWDNYPEDIKDQIGAGAVAAWQGEIVEIVPDASDSDAGLEMMVAVALKAPWDAVEAAMPLLLREPFGHTLLPESTSKRDTVMVYRYVLPGVAVSEFPSWVELRTPRKTRRFPLTRQGKWKP